MNLHVLQHIHCEGPGCIADWARERGATISTTHLYRGESLPDPGTVDFLVVMGGPMNIYQDRDHPWLLGERAFIKAHISAGKPVVGVCLGSQFLADALGGRVIQNPHIEIGCFPVEFTAEARARFPFLPASLPVTHWHGDTFVLPAGALRLATSVACLNQGFVYGNHVLALQFHPEVTHTDLVAWVQSFDANPEPSAYVQTGETILATPDEVFIAGHAMLRKLLDAIFG
ncbi:MAG: type 1 glutamine amidotransferase [Chthoniobacterales bacterium]